MNIRISILVSIAVGSCGKPTSDFHNGAPDAPPKIWLDAREWMDAEIFKDAHIYEDAKIYMDAHEFHDAKIWSDAHIFEDAHIYEDAHVYNDAAIPRSCINVSETLFNGHETLEVSVQCETPGDAGAAHLTVAGTTAGSGAGSGSAYTEDVAFTLVCGTYGHPANNFFDITTTDVLLATKIATATFDVTCN